MTTEDNKQEVLFSVLIQQGVNEFIQQVFPLGEFWIIQTNLRLVKVPK